MRSPAPVPSLIAASGAALLAAVTCSPAPASGAWLDEPPRVCTFKLDDPTVARLPLLDAFRDAAVEPGSVVARYLDGPWARRQTQPWWGVAAASLTSGASGASLASIESLASGVSGAAAESKWEPVGPDETEPTFGLGDLDGGAGALPLLNVSPAATPAWLDPSFTTPIVKTPGAIFASNGFDALWSLPPAKPVPNWRCRRRPVRMARYGGESDAFNLVRCDGSVAPQAFDRLTLMAREATAPRPGELLPDEPDPDALARGEWTAGVRLVHPRLLWAIQRIADAFPWRTIYVFSGYRHDPSGVRPKPGTHHSMHSEARAMDIYVMGVPNAALFQVCQKLQDVGCGFYPNNKFVHVDVRRPGSGHPFWVDVSGPGEPSRYVDAWPGVIDGGGLVWDPVGRAAEKAAAAGAGKPGSEAASCTGRTGPSRAVSNHP